MKTNFSVNSCFVNSSFKCSRFIEAQRDWSQNKVWAFSLSGFKANLFRNLLSATARIGPGFDHRVVFTIFTLFKHFVVCDHFLIARMKKSSFDFGTETCLGRILGWRGFFNWRSCCYCHFDGKVVD